LKEPWSLPSMGAININPYNMDAFVIAVLTLGVYNLYIIYDINEIYIYVYILQMN
jgi:hypothetical protein